MTVRLSRRAVLKGAGGIALSLPLLPSLGAFAQTGGVAPKRFLVIYHPNGVLPSEWFPTPGTSETDFTFSSSLEPLAPYREHVLITRGIDLACTAVGPGEPHQKGMGGVLTGWHLNEGTFVGGDGSLAGYAKGISIDQRIAQVLGTTTRFGSLNLGIRPRGGDVRHHISYAGSDQPVPCIADPVVAWNMLFSDFTAPSPELDRVRARRASVLDAVREQLAIVQKQVAASERAQLERHLELVRDLEVRLAATTNGAACTRPDQPPAMAIDSAETMPELSTWQIDLMVMAFACDLTRVGLLQFGQADNQLTFPWLGSTMDGHALSHLGSSDPTRVQIGWRDHWYAERLAYLLGRLKEIPEGDGTLLDHTQILWVNELSEGNSHSLRSMPFILAGHAAGFRMGRYVQYDGASHSDLLLSLLHGMGVDDETFGNPDYCHGELANLT
ncbi:MAG: DUF1552 domain-containing protein [Myxococcaceae bacterium]|nr:DUF1552 domain-containing protein [Myxococcaceae bacterium]